MNVFRTEVGMSRCRLDSTDAEADPKFGNREKYYSLQGLERSELAELYRQATYTLVISESEGFGLPVIEALACGSPVVATRIPVLREVGGDAVTFAL